MIMKYKCVTSPPTETQVWNLLTEFWVFSERKCIREHAHQVWLRNLKTEGAMAFLRLDFPFLWGQLSW